MRYFGYFWAIVFIVFAILQFNDPDPYIWIPIYLAAAVLSVLAAIGQFNKLLLSVCMVSYFVGGLLLFPMHIDEWLHNEEKAKSLDMKMPFIEEARESMGLFICFGVITVYLFASTAKPKRRTRR